MKTLPLAIAAFFSVSFISGCEINKTMQSLHETMSNVNESLASVTGTSNSTASTETSTKIKSSVKKTGAVATISEMCSLAEKNNYKAKKQYLGASLSVEGTVSVLPDNSDDHVVFINYDPKMYNYEDLNSSIGYTAKTAIARTWENGEIRKVTGIVDQLDYNGLSCQIWIHEE